MDKTYIIKMNNEAELKIHNIKLKDELESLLTVIKNELSLMEKEGDNYKPSNKLGIISARGNAIDNLMGSISVLNNNRNMLNMLEDKNN